MGWASPGRSGRPSNRLPACVSCSASTRPMLAKSANRAGWQASHPGSVMKLEIETVARGPNWRFYGDDWTELGQVFGILCQHDDPQTAGHIRERLDALAMRIHDALEQEGKARPADLQRVQACRAWMRALTVQAMARHDYEVSLYHGLNEIADDWTFLKYVAVLLGELWT